MKTIIALILSLFLVSPVYADSLFFQSFDSTDWTLIGGTFLSDFGDFQTSAVIPSLAEHGYPGYVEGNPLILRTFGTNLPSEAQYAAWFAGEFILQSATACILPLQWRDAMMGAFIGIGSIDVANNQLIHSYYMGNNLTVPFPDGNNSDYFNHDAFNGTDLALWSGFAASQGMVMMQDMSNPALRRVRSDIMISTAETIGVITLISAVLPERWRDALFGYEIGMSGAQMTFINYRR